MTSKLIAGLTAGTLALGTVLAYAQSSHHGHGSHHTPAAATDHSAHGSSKPKGDAGPSSLAFHAINAKMHEGMDITFTGNADIDFVRGMIPHHQGAVDMAKTVHRFRQGSANPQAGRGDRQGAGNGNRADADLAEAEREIAILTNQNRPARAGRFHSLSRITRRA